MQVVARELQCKAMRQNKCRKCCKNLKLQLAFAVRAAAAALCLLCGCYLVRLGGNLAACLVFALVRGSMIKDPVKDLS